MSQPEELLQDFLESDDLQTAMNHADTNQHMQLSRDAEWNTSRVNHFMDYISAFSHGVLAADWYFQGYTPPPNFEHALTQFCAAFAMKTEGEELPKLSLLDFEGFVLAFLEANCMTWNEVEGPQFCSRYSATPKKRSFIDLHAASRNAALYIRSDRRESDAFNERFDRENPAPPVKPEEVKERTR